MTNRMKWLKVTEYVPDPREDMSVLVSGGNGYHFCNVEIDEEGNINGQNSEYPYIDVQWWTVIVTPGYDAEVDVMDYAITLDEAKEIARHDDDNNDKEF